MKRTSRTIDSRASEICKAYLLDSRNYNESRNILPSENRIINNLQKHSENLKPVYDELVQSLNKQQYGLVLDLIVSCAAFWNPEKAMAYRNGKKDLIQTNRLIGEKAHELADLLEKRESLQSHSGFTCDTHYSIIDVINNASENNYLYVSHVKNKLQSLNYQFDLKYWSNLPEIVREIAKDSCRAKVEASDSITNAATDSEQTSKVDFLKAFLVSIKKGNISYKITDKSLAEIMNCALDLGVEDIVDAAYIKRARQRLRYRSKY